MSETGRLAVADAAGVLERVRPSGEVALVFPLDPHA
jgi:hypothetical protein